MIDLKNYDENNIFAKILRGEVPAKKIAEDENFLSFEDAFPVADKHLLVIPKKAYTCFPNFVEKAENGEVEAFFQFIKQVATQEGLGEEGQGYRLVTNYGERAGQSVPHFHMHIIGGQQLGKMA